ncbi:MAG: RNA polymerase factor sigma-54 [Anaerolineaceae bacterium]
MFQSQVQKQHQATAHLAQTMTLLSLSAFELRQQIDSELSSNPALEIVEERRCPNCNRVLPPEGMCPLCSRPTNLDSMEPVVYVSPIDDFFPKRDYVDQDYPDEPISPVTEDLSTFVLRQIATELNKNQQIIAIHLLTNLDDDGFLTVSIPEVARYFHLPISAIEEVQRIIQLAEPIGVGSIDPRQAMKVQLEVLSESTVVPEYAFEIINEYLDLLSRRQYGEIAKNIGISAQRVEKISEFISENLNPFPGRSHWGSVRNPSTPETTVYHQPDVIISFMNDNPKSQLVVEIIMPIGGTLQVSSLYKKAIKQSEGESRDAMREDLDKASLFVKCLQQRNHTMQRLMQRLVVIQKNYLTKGEKYLEPITRATLAGELGVHESTISRAVSGKSVQLPNKRIVPMSSLFDRSLSARTILREIISSEVKPLSDTEIQIKLDERGIQVARRTVAKYRAMEGILPAHLRQST